MIKFDLKRMLSTAFVVCLATLAASAPISQDKGVETKEIPPQKILTPPSADKSKLLGQEEESQLEKLIQPHDSELYRIPKIKGIKTSRISSEKVVNIDGKEEKLQKEESKVVDPVDDSIIEDVIQETKSTKANPQAKTVKVTNTKVLIPKEGIDKEITSAEEDDNKEVKESDMYPQRTGTMTYVDFSPRAVAEFLLKYQDFDGFLAALDDIERSKVMTADEIALYKQQVAWEYDMLLREQEAYTKLLGRPPYSIERPSQTQETDKEGSMPADEPKQDKPLPPEPAKKSGNAPLKESNDKPEQESSKQTQVMDKQNNGKQIPLSIDSSIIASNVFADYDIEDEIINALLYDWLNGKLRRGEKNPLLSFDDFMGYLFKEADYARRRGKDDVARVMELLADALITEQQKGDFNDYPNFDPKLKSLQDLDAIPQKAPAVNKQVPSQPKQTTKEKLPEPEIPVHQEEPEKVPEDIPSKPTVSTGTTVAETKESK